MHPETILDFLAAHRKLIVAALTAVLPQLVHGNTADVLILVLGLLATGAVPNDEAARDRIYKKRR